MVLPKVYYERKVDGLIILGQVSKPYIEALQNIDITIVFLDFYDENSQIDSIAVDNFNSAYELTNYLIKNGHENIGFVGNIYATSSIQDRFLGFYKSLLEHGYKLNYDYVISDRDEYGKYIDIKLPTDMPTAYVCNCDEVARNVINKLKEMGKAVPNDISIVGFDNDMFSTISEPQLTTVEVDVEEMSRMAIKFILGKISNESKRYGRVMVKGRIVYRQSVKNILSKNIL